ncbi:MAG: hypothetical protein HRU43_02885 [Simkaniaceae bacterium]|nr:hypothetical protein [Simkaniaceae bacterium]
MRTIDILPKAPIQEIKPIFSQERDWIVAHSAGVLHTNVSLGQIIQTGETIGTIKAPFESAFSEKIKAP